MAGEKEADGGGPDGKQARISMALNVTFVLVTLIGLVILIVWLALQPKKPQFILQDVTLYRLNLSDPNLLTTYMQVTITTRNPNTKIGISYERLDVFASYHNQEITMVTTLPRTYQGIGDMAVWSPFLYGNAVPVSPSIAYSLSLDMKAGVVLVDIKVDGRLKWKVGTMLTSKYHLSVHCPAYITFGSQSKGIDIGSAIKYQFVQGCTVEV